MGPYEKKLRAQQPWPYSDQLQRARMQDALNEALEGWKSALSAAVNAGAMPPAIYGIAKMSIERLEGVLAKAGM